MRPQQQGRRSRNRGGGRRNQNPLQRSYESNGPDVKIRGNAQVIADKYATLARDALSSGDSVMAENYLQHAEHYNRIILAAQPQPRDDDDEQGEGQQSANGEDRQAQNQGRGQDDDGQPGRRQRRRRERNDDADGAQAEAADNAAEPSPAQAEGEVADASQMPQPVIEGTPAEVRAEQAEQDGAPEKPRRTRSPRKKVEADGAETAEQAPGEQEAAVAAE